jgi:hypothetical protein
MNAILDQWLSCLALAAIIIAFLFRQVQRRGDSLAWIMGGYFCVCFSLIVIKWYLRLDLAVYDSEKYQSAGAQIAGLLRADFLGDLRYAIKPYAAYTLPLGAHVLRIRHLAAHGTAPQYHHGAGGHR